MSTPLKAQLTDLDDPLAPARSTAPAPVTRASADASASKRSPSTAKPAQTRSRASTRRPAAERPVSVPPAAPPTAGSSLADEQLVAVFARVPESLSDALADTVRTLNAGRARRARVSQQDVVGALLARYTTQQQADELSELVDGYRQRIRR